MLKRNVVPTAIAGAILGLFVVSSSFAHGVPSGEAANGHHSGVRITFGTPRHTPVQVVHAPAPATPPAPMPQPRVPAPTMPATPPAKTTSVPPPAPRTPAPTTTIFTFVSATGRIGRDPLDTTKTPSFSRCATR